MLVTMVETRWGSEDDYVVTRFVGGNSYDMADSLARFFIRDGAAYEVGFDSPPPPVSNPFAFKFPAFTVGAVKSFSKRVYVDQGALRRAESRKAWLSFVWGGAFLIVGLVALWFGYADRMAVLAPMGHSPIAEALQMRDSELKEIKP